MNSSNAVTILSSNSSASDLMLKMVAYEKELAVATSSQPGANGEVLTTREVEISDLEVACEYLEEKFAQPNLLPSNIGQRARERMLTRRIIRDLHPMADRAIAGCVESQEAVLASVKELSALLAHSNYLTGEELSFADCAMAPVIWSMKQLSPSVDKHLAAYFRRLIDRPSFRKAIAK